ncbi:hypothetical protein BDA96_08G132600 [Sorghum bicolor]|jgi:hypothetical protein|uniref:Uncharacterized protein n=2 Tax=Sorghum bicolor TaxID=4558 RepID=A0A921U7F3_SORBI|nr:hypothetical protein BDA96_08G132600 [Sorghum bicolor]KXG23621.1 hypothetical protein SORBI_3008G119200 [Sorghum bicolor]
MCAASGRGELEGGLWEEANYGWGKVLGLVRLGAGRSRTCVGVAGRVLYAGTKGWGGFLSSPSGGGQGHVHISTSFFLLHAGTGAGVDAYEGLASGH